MSEPTLVDVTQVLLKQNQELTVNTAETNKLNQVLNNYQKF